MRNKIAKLLHHATFSSATATVALTPVLALSAMVRPCVLFSIPHSNARLAPRGPHGSAAGPPPPSSHLLANASGLRFQRRDRDELSLSWRRRARCRSTAPPVSIGGDGLQLTSAAEEEEEEEDAELCPVECVREFKTDEEFNRILDKAKGTGALVVVDFYRTACGSCKYIEQGFAKLCKGSGNQEANVVFLKHNVVDEYDEQSEVAERLRIKAVPLFHFIKDGVLLEAFPTRDKERILAAILKYTSS